MEQIIEELLIKLNKSPTDIAKNKFGKTPEINCYELLYSVLSTSTLTEAGRKFGITQKPINAALKRLLPEVKLAGGGATWKHTLLALVSYKHCNGCNSIKPIMDFSINTSRCKICISIRNTSETIREYNREYYKYHYSINPKYYLYKTEKRSKRIKIATPRWADQEAITAFYINCPKGYHVDHIIPLQGINVCGLHVLSNLQYLPAKENLQKGNRFVGEESWD